MSIHSENWYAVWTAARTQGEQKVHGSYYYIQIHSTVLHALLGLGRNTYHSTTQVCLDPCSLNHNYNEATAFLVVVDSACSYKGSL